MQGVTELGYVRFGVSDLSAWREFATQLIGLEAFSEGDDKQLFLRSDFWHHRIELVEDGADDLIAAGLRVAGAAEFTAMQRTLVEAGVDFEVGSKQLAAERRVHEVMMLRDPADNPLEIFHGPQVDSHKPFYPGRRMFGRFVTGSGGVGHMIMRHAGLDQMHAFYVQLGMRGGVKYKVPLPDGNVAEVLFMHCNDRDHSFAFGPPSTKSVNHLMLEVDNLDDVMMTQELVQASPYPITISFGRHANDHMLSFYCATPSQWMLEIGHAGRPSTHQSEYYVRDTYGHVQSAALGARMSIDKD